MIKNAMCVFKRMCRCLQIFCDFCTLLVYVNAILISSQIDVWILFGRVLFSSLGIMLHSEIKTQHTQTAAFAIHVDYMGIGIVVHACVLECEFISNNFSYAIVNCIYSITMHLYKHIT